MKTRFILLIIVFLLGWLGPNQALASAAPVGYWMGNFSNGQPLTLNVGGNGDVFLHVSGMEPVTGTWNWNPTSRGGRLTITYRRVGFTNHLYYAITYVNANQILFGDPKFTIILRRR